MKNAFFLISLSLICCISTVAQISTDKAIINALLIGRTLPQEHVYMHFDNTVYYLGETIWFKAFVTSGRRGKQANMSRVLYVELISPEGYVVKKLKYRIADDGTCHGEIFMDPNYFSGLYEVRAYTRYMLNRGDASVFSRVFPVYDQVKNGNWAFRNMLERHRRFIKDGEWRFEDERECSIQFYPEGGHLVAGIESKVAFELRYADGKPADDDCYIKIFNENKEIVTTCPKHEGKGSFSITSEKNARYKALVTMKDSEGKKKEYSFKLPKVEDEGVSLSVTSKGDNICFSISNNYTKRKELAFAILHRGEIGFCKRLYGRIKRLEFSKDTLPEGVCRAIVFDGDVPLAERLFFVRHKELKKNDFETVKLRIMVNGSQEHKLNIQPYEKISLTIEREDGKPLDENCQYTVSVVDRTGIQNTSWGYNLYTYQLLGSELKGYIPNVWQYFDPQNRERDSLLDLIMLTHGWTSYDWSMLATANMNDIVPPEKGLYIRGRFVKRVRRRNLGYIGNYRIDPQPYNQIRLDYTLDGNIVTTAFRTDEKGEFTVEVDSFIGRQVVALSPQTRIRHSENINYTFSLDRYFSPVPRFFHYHEKHFEKSPANNEINCDNNTPQILGHNEYLLSELVVKASEDTRFYAPPNSEMHLDYLDEWEYANDITYFIGNDRTQSLLNKERIMMKNAVSDYIFQDTTFLNDDSLSRQFNIYEDSRRNALPQYRGFLTAAQVLASALTRHGLQSGWTQPVVIKGEYNRDSLPEIDEEFLHGINVERMVNFKEIIITSDRNKCKVVKSGAGEAFSAFKSSALSNKGKYSIFYEGFLSTNGVNALLFPGWDKDEFTRIHMRKEGLRASKRNLASSRNAHPDHLACFIPFNSKDSTGYILPDFTTSSSTRRYTSLQGYSQSKQFYSPDYSKEVPQKEDFRRTLFWNPTVSAIKGKLQIELYNGCECSSIAVNVLGYNNGTIYSNDTGITNRFSEDNDDVVGKAMEIKNPNTPVYDSIFIAQCKEEFDKAEMYFNQKRYSKCINTYIELVQYDYLPALYRVGYSYKHGLALTKNDSLAIRFFKDAAEKGDARSQHEYAIMLMNGEGTAASPAMAVEWFGKSASQGYANAQTELAKCYLEGKGTARDSIAAGKLLKVAALDGYPEALYLYATYMQKNGIERDTLIGTYINCYMLSATKGFQPAMEWRINYEDANGNYKQAYIFAKELYMMKNIYGTRYMAGCYRYGRGVKRDKKLAKDLYREAALWGCEKSKKILEEW